MSTLLTESAASAFIALDETDGATLTQIARATGRPTSTIQRALSGLIEAGIVSRESPRGRFVLASDAPRRAIREIAEWRVGAAVAVGIRESLHGTLSDAAPSAPSTVTSPRIRAAWPAAIRAIAATFEPRRVILFGSQARGDARADSDVDLLVVFDGQVDKRERRVKIRQALAHMPFAKDVLVATTAEIAHPMPGSALVGALREGIVVYER